MSKVSILNNIAFLLMSLLFLGNDLFANGKEILINIKKEGNLITAELKDAPIETVIKNISTDFDFKYKIFPEMQNKFITSRVEKAFLLEAIKKILGDNYLIELDNNGMIKKVYILNKGNKDFDRRNELIETFLNKKIFSMDQLKEIITKNVQKEHPKAQLFTVIPNEDIKGNLRSYIFSYFIGSGDMPSLENIKRDIHEAWEYKKESRKQIARAYENRDSSTIIEWIQKTKPFEERLRENEEYITLEIAATYDNPPVIQFYKGLPYNLAMYPNAVEILERKIKETGPVSFTRTFAIGALAIGFEFRNERNGTPYWVDVFNGIVFDKWSEHETAKEQKGDADRLERVKRNWETFIGL